LVYLVATYLLCRRLFGDGLLLVLSVAMLTLNPEIMDFMAAARGYMLGLACLMLASFIMYESPSWGLLTQRSTRGLEAPQSPP